MAFISPLRRKITDICRVKTWKAANIAVVFNFNLLLVLFKTLQQTHRNHIQLAALLLPLHDGRTTFIFLGVIIDCHDVNLEHLAVQIKCGRQLRLRISCLLCVDSHVEEFRADLNGRLRRFLQSGENLIVRKSFDKVGLIFGTCELKTQRVGLEQGLLGRILLINFENYSCYLRISQLANFEHALQQLRFNLCA